MNEKILIAGATILIHCVVLTLVVVIDGMATSVQHEVLNTGISVDSRPTVSKHQQGTSSFAGTGNSTNRTKIQTYVVQAGDNLSKIANLVYGDSMHYMDIFEANKDRLKTPKSIRIGQKLIMPAIHSTQKLVNN